MELFFGKFITLLIGINGATAGVISKTYHSLLDLDTVTRHSAVFWKMTNFKFIPKIT